MTGDVAKENCAAGKKVQTEAAPAGKASSTPAPLQIHSPQLCAGPASFGLVRDEDIRMPQQLQTQQVQDFS